MPMIVTSRPRQRQPTTPVGLDVRTPLARGVLCAYAAGAAPALPSGGAIEPQSGFEIVSTPAGPGSKRALSSGAIIGRTNPAAAPSDVTVVLSVYRYVDAGVSAWSIYWVTPGYYNRVELSSGHLGFYLSRASTATETTAAGAVPAPAGAYTFVITSRSTGDVAVYRDGQLVHSATSGSGSAVWAYYGSAAPIYVQYNTGSSPAVCSVTAAAVYTRALSDAEARELSRNPWQLFAPVRRPVFFGDAPAVETKPFIVTSRPRSRQPAHALALNGADPAARLLVGLFAPWSRTDAVTGAPLSGWTGLGAIGAAIGGVAAIGAGSNYITGPAGYGRWAGKSVWGLILAFRLRSTSQTNTYVIRQGVGGGAQASLIYGFASQQFELYSDGYSGTNPRTGSQIAVSDTQVHTLAYVADGTRTRGILDGRIVIDVAATTTFFGGGGEPSTHLMAVNGGEYCAIEIYALGFWAGAVPRVEDVREATRNPWRMFAPVRRPVFFVSAGGVYDVALSESASASDSLGAAGALTSALAEAASAADVVSAAAAFAAAMSEVATATDGTAAVSVVLGALTEGGTGVDTLTSTISGAGVYDVALLESATTADAETAGGVFYVSVSEQGVGSEALSTGGVFYVTLADSGTGTDVLSGHLPTSFSAALSASVSALDVMVSTIPSAGTLWTAMDTAAASGWTAVATTTNTWTIVPTT